MNLITGEYKLEEVVLFCDYRDEIARRKSEMIREELIRAGIIFQQKPIGILYLEPFTDITIGRKKESYSTLMFAQGCESILGEFRRKLAKIRCVQRRDADYNPS